MTAWYQRTDYPYQAGYRLCPSPGLYTRADYRAALSLYNIETMLCSTRAAVFFLDYGRPADYPLPDLDLTTRPRQSEIVQYADYSQRAQGPYSFQWGFRAMKPWVLGLYMYYFGFEDWNYSLYAVYDYATPVWSVPVDVMTLDTKGEKTGDYSYPSSAGAYDNYRLFSGTFLRPVPGQDYKIGIGGNYENVIFRFVGCTEVLA